MVSAVLQMEMRAAYQNSSSRQRERLTELTKDAAATNALRRRGTAQPRLLCVAAAKGL